MWLRGARFNRKRPASANFGRFPGCRQRLVNHARRCTQQYDLLTSVVKPITTAFWQCCGNRAATARGELSVIGKIGFAVFRKDHAPTKS